MVTKSANLGSSSLVNWDRDRVVDVKLVLGLHGFRGAGHNLVHGTHGTGLDNPNHGGFHKESGPRGSCSKEVFLILVV